MALLKIISGGQTGVDRAALDAALACGIECGGCCPAGRLDENGVIPERYPLKELNQGGFSERTLQNIDDSDGTAIIHFGRLQGGTKETLSGCIARGKPHTLIEGGEIPVERAVVLLDEFVRAHRLRVLNVAGPRASEAPEGYGYAYRLLNEFLQCWFIERFNRY